MSEEIKLSKEQLAKLRTAEELECVDMKLTKILYGQGEGCFAIFETDTKTIGLPLNSFEGTMVSFAHAGCINFSHIKTIHQLFLGFLDDIGARVESALIESKHGDIIYAQLAFRDRKNRRIFAQVSYADALIVSILTKCDFKIVRKVLDKLEDFNEWTYQNEITDLEDED